MIGSTYSGTGVGEGEGVGVAVGSGEGVGVGVSSISVTEGAGSLLSAVEEGAVQVTLPVDPIVCLSLHAQHNTDVITIAVTRTAGIIFLFIP